MVNLYSLHGKIILCLTVLILLSSNALALALVLGDWNPSKCKSNSSYDVRLSMTKDVNSYNSFKENVCFTRKNVIRNIVQSSSLYIASTVHASAVQAIGDDKDNFTLEPSSANNILRPRAPVKALIPVTKVRLALRKALLLSKEIQKTDSSSDKAWEMRSELKQILFEKQDYAPPKELNIKLPSTTIYDKTYVDQLSKMSPGDALLALPVQLGERDTAARLKRRQNRMGEKDPIRGAFNYYTSQLQFDTETYLLNATGEERKRLIRDKGLPDIKSVIVSDLDLRDLLRNSILDLWEDASAEYTYQEREATESETFNVQELLEILEKANETCDTWFSFIPNDDVKKAEASIMSET